VGGTRGGASFVLEGENRLGEGVTSPGCNKDGLRMGFLRENWSGRDGRAATGTLEARLVSLEE